jgi:hypothetical protein
MWNPFRQLRDQANAIADLEQRVKAAEESMLILRDHVAALDQRMTRPDVAHFRNHGVTHLCINCIDLACNHQTLISLEGLPDDLVLADLKPRMRCARCGRKGADVRPDWRPHVKHGPQA